MSDVSYAYIPNNLFPWPLYNWKTTNLVVFHSFECFKNQVITLDANNLTKKAYKDNQNFLLRVS